MHLLRGIWWAAHSSIWLVRRANGDPVTQMKLPMSQRIRPSRVKFDALSPISALASSEWPTTWKRANEFAENYSFRLFFHSFAGQKLLSTRARHALEFRLVDMAVLSIRYLWCEESLTPDSLINFVLFRRFFCAKFNLVLFVCFFFSSSTLWPVSSFIQLIGDLSELREKSYDDNGRAIASSCSSINSRQEVQSGNNQIFSLTKKKSKHDPWFPSNFNWKQMKSCKVYWVAESNLGLKSFIN